MCIEFHSVLILNLLFFGGGNYFFRFCYSVESFNIKLTAQKLLLAREISQCHENVYVQISHSYSHFYNLSSV